MNNFDFKKFEEKNWHFTYDRKMSLQRIHLFHFGYCDQFSNFFKVKIDSEVYRIKDESVSVYYELDDHTEAFEAIRKNLYCKDAPKLIKKIKDTITEYYKEFIRDIKAAPLDYSKVSNSKLINSFKNFYRQNEKISLPTWLLYLYIEDILTEILKEKLGVKIKDESVLKDVLHIVGRPDKILPLDAYHIDLYKIVLLPRSKQDGALHKFTKKYASWGFYDVNFELQNTDSHRGKMAGLSVRDAKSKIKEIESKYKKEAQDLLKIKKYWLGDFELRALIGLYRLYANFKDWKNYYREQSAYKMKFLFDEIASRLGLSRKEVSFLTEEETIEALKMKGGVDRNLITKRIANSALVFVNGHFSFVTDLNNLNSIDNKLEVKEVLSIKGAIAFPGVVRGEVKIIASTNDFVKFKEGDILVSSTTRPDYLTFMKMSAGFITNEGGMLSHAAILARELKKPCIIGTKIATKVLKDGDLVEVDAEKGIVTILKSAH
ncbi:MAG: PEP-utilizing enzyme [Patescibacteria group bacterium]